MRLEDRELVLASASPRRLELLRQIGLCPGVRPSEADEHSSERNPALFVQELARRKAGLVAATETDGTLVIGADTVVVLDARYSESRRTARRRRRCFADCRAEHMRSTPVSRCSSREKTRSGSLRPRPRVYIAPMTEDEIQAYVDSGEPMDKAGAYGIQGRFACFVEKIEGEYSNVVGLPLAALRRAAQELERDGK